jgi:hypothetical protein
MPYSSTFAKLEIQNHFDKNFSREIKILDVGPGAGMYSALLSCFSPILGYSLDFKLDCLEIWEPYVYEFNLKNFYNNVYIGDIRNFDFLKYDYIILGDILEHLNTKDAQKIINTICDNNQKCLVAVPYLWEQGPVFDNPYEEHLQPDLTHALMLERYPSLHLLFGNEGYGYYINYTI